MLRYFHRADLDDLTKPGFTLLRAHVGGTRCEPEIVDPEDSGGELHMYERVVGGRHRWVGIRILIDMPTPMRRMFEMDFRRYRAERGVNWWVRVDLCWFGFFSFAYGSRARGR